MHRSPAGLNGGCIKAAGRSCLWAVPGLFYFVTCAMSVSVVQGPQLLPTCAVFSHLCGGGEAQLQSQ